MPTRPRSALFLGMALVASHAVAAQEPPLRRNAPDAASGTSAAVVVDSATALAHAVQIYPVDLASGGKVVGPVRADEQAEEVLNRLQRVLHAASSGFDRLVKLDVYVARPEVIATFRAALARRMTGKRGPAISFVVGALAYPKALVALDAVAATPLPQRGESVTRINQKVGDGHRTSGLVAILPAGSRVYISGQADPGTDMAQATRRTLEGLDRSLVHVGLDRSRVVRVKAFLRPMSAAEEVEREVVAFFGSEAVPPLTLVEWQSKNPIEIEFIAAGDREPAGDVVEYLTPPGLKPSPVFSRVARVNRGDLIYVSGLYGPAPSSGARQVESIFEALGKHLEAAGSDFRHLVKATYYITDEDASRALNELRPKYYDAARPPAASKATVAGVDPAGRSITLDMIAVVKPAAGGDQGRIAPRPPNVVLLLSDDQRPDTIAALGNRLIQTPNLDRLVRAGTTFARAVSPNPICVSSRAEILSGCTGFRNGVIPPFHTRLDPELVLWPEAMRKAGYCTWYTGKWHTDGRPTTRGFDESQGMFALGGPTTPARLDTQGREITGYVGAVFQSDDGLTFPEWGVGLTPETPARIADAAIGFIRRKSERPFFLHVNFTAPHDPLLPPPALADRYDVESIPLPANFLPEHPFDHGNLRGRDELLWPWPRTPRMVRDELALYYAVITDLDAQIGRILTALEETGQADRTIVVFTSDQGLAIGSHGLRGKQNMYEHTVGTPLVIAGPGLPRDRRVRAPIYLRDLYPTICELAGVATPEGIDGRSRAAVLRGGEDEGDRLVYGYYMDTQRMVRGDRWKLIRYPKAAREQLFDLAADPWEQHDLSVDPAHAAVRNELRAELLAWQKQNHDPLLEKPQPFVHPGMLQSRADLNFMKLKVAAAEEPWKSAWEFLLRQSESSLEFKPQPFAKVIRGPYGNPNIGGNELAISARAAHNHALQWVVTGNRAHADKVIEILAAWSPVLESFHENDAKLLAGWTGHAFCNAAEIIRWTDAGWQEKDIAAFKRMLLQVYYPLIADFFPEANGNWDAAIIDTMLCIGIFCDDRVIFDRAVNQYLRGPVNAGITHYVYPSGQCQESTRDQAHVQLGLGECAQACQVAWTQGVDLFGAADNRLALGFEYTARFLAGEQVPAQGGLFPRRPGRLSPIYEEVYQHYRFVKGLDMPYSQRALERTRPRSWTALTSYRGPVADGSSPQPTGPPRPSEIAAGAGALREPSAKPPAGAIVVNPGESIQQALDSRRGQGDWVVLASGLHRLPAPLKIPSGVTLAGHGFDSILWLDPKLTGPTIVSSREGLVNVTIRDLVIEGATASSLPSDPNADRRRRSRPDAPSRAGIEFVSANPLGGTTNLRLERVVVRNCTATGVNIQWASEIVIHDCDFSDNGSSAPPGPGAHHNLALAYAVKCEITGNVLSTSPSGSGAELTQCSKFIIAGNETARNSQCGIRVVDCEDIKLERNLAEGNNRGGIITEAVKQGCRRIEVLANRARNNGGYGIDIRGTRDATLRDNTALDNGRPEQTAVTTPGGS